MLGAYPARIGLGVIGRLLRCQQVEQARIHEPAGLGAVTCYLKSRIETCFGNGGKVDVSGNVLQTGPVEGVRMCAMPVMTHEGATGALMMIELVTRKARSEEHTSELQSHHD